MNLDENNNKSSREIKDIRRIKKTTMLIATAIGLLTVLLAMFFRSRNRQYLEQVLIYLAFLNSLIFIIVEFATYNDKYFTKKDKAPYWIVNFLLFIIILFFAYKDNLFNFFNVLFMVLSMVFIVLASVFLIFIVKEKR